MPEEDIAGWLDQVTAKAREAYKAVSDLKAVQATKRAGSAMLGPGLMGGFMGYEAFASDKGFTKGIADSITTMKVAEMQGKLFANSLRTASQAFIQQNTLIAKSVEGTAKVVETFTSVSGMMDKSVKTLSASTSILGKSFLGLGQAIKLVTGPVGTVIAVGTIMTDVLTKWADAAEKTDSKISAMSATFKGFSKDSKSFDSGFMERAAGRFAGKGVSTEAFAGMMGRGATYGLDQTVVAQAVAIANAVSKRTGVTTEEQFGKIIDNIFAKSTTMQKEEFAKLMRTERLMAGPIRQAGPGIGATYEEATLKVGREINEIAKILGQQMTNFKLAMGASPFRQQGIGQMITAPLYEVGRDVSAGVGAGMRAAGGAASNYLMNMMYGAYARPGATALRTLMPFTGMLPASQRPEVIGGPADLANVMRTNAAIQQMRRGQAQQAATAVPTSYFAGEYDSVMMPSVGQMDVNEYRAAGRRDVIAGARGVIGGHAQYARSRMTGLQEEMGKLEERSDKATLTLELLDRMEKMPEIDKVYTKHAELMATATKAGTPEEREKTRKELKDFQEKHVKEIPNFFETMQMMEDNKPIVDEANKNMKATKEKFDKDKKETDKALEEKRKQYAHFKEVEESGLKFLGIKREGLEDVATVSPKGQEDFVRTVQQKLIESKQKLEQYRKMKSAGQNITKEERDQFNAAIAAEKEAMFQMQGYDTNSEEYKAYKKAEEEGQPPDALAKLWGKVKKGKTKFMEAQEAIETRRTQFALNIKPEVEKMEKAQIEASLEDLKRMGGSKEAIATIKGKLAEGTGAGIQEAELLTDIESRRIKTAMYRAAGGVEAAAGVRMGGIQRGIAAGAGIRLGAESGALTSEIQPIREQAMRVLEIRKDMFEKEIDFTTKYAEARMNVIKEHYDHMISMEKLKLEARDRQYAPHMAYGREYFEAGQQAIGVQRGRYAGEDYWRGQYREGRGLAESRQATIMGAMGMEMPREVQLARALRNQREQEQDFRRERMRQAREDAMQMQNYRGTMGAMGQVGVGTGELMGTEQGRNLWLGMLQQSQGAFSRRGVDVAPQMFQIIQRQQEEAGKKLAMELQTRKFRGRMFEEQTGEMEGEIGKLGTEDQQNRARMNLAGKYKEAASYYESVGDVAKYKEYQEKYQKTLETIPAELKRLHDDQMKIANVELLKHTELLKEISKALGGGGGKEVTPATTGESATETPPQESTPEQKGKIAGYYSSPKSQADFKKKWKGATEAELDKYPAYEPPPGDAGDLFGATLSGERREGDYAIGAWNWIKNKFSGMDKLERQAKAEAKQWSQRSLSRGEIDTMRHNLQQTQIQAKNVERQKTWEQKSLEELPEQTEKWKKGIATRYEKMKGLGDTTEARETKWEDIRTNRRVARGGIGPGTVNVVPSNYEGRGVSEAESKQIEEENKNLERWATSPYDESMINADKAIKDSAKLDAREYVKEYDRKKEANRKVAAGVPSWAPTGAVWANVGGPQVTSGVAASPDGRVGDTGTPENKFGGSVDKFGNFISKIEKGININVYDKRTTASFGGSDVPSY